jgi:hypothetical protein
VLVKIKMIMLLKLQYLKHNMVEIINKINIMLVKMVRIIILIIIKNKHKLNWNKKIVLIHQFQ